jgi:hypothetical protein
MPFYNNQNRKPNQNNKSGYMGKNWKYKHYVHSPFSIEHNGINAKVDDHGKIVITQDHPDGTYDEVLCSASFIYKLNDMLLASMRVVFRDEPFKEVEGSNSGEVEDTKNAEN